MRVFQVKVDDALAAKIASLRKAFFEAGLLKKDTDYAFTKYCLEHVVDEAMSAISLGREAKPIVGNPTGVQ